MYRTLSSVKYYKSYINLHSATRSLFCVFLLCFFVVGAVFLFFGDLAFAKNAEIDLSVSLVLGFTARFLDSLPCRSQKSPSITPTFSQILLLLQYK